jgi:hypothetical protein
MKHRIPQSLYILFGCMLALLTNCKVSPSPEPTDLGLQMPKPREVTKEERKQLTELVWEHFKVRIPDQAQFQAAEPFRFVAADDVLYSERTDTGSVLFENTKYGISEKELNPALVERESLLPQIESAIAKTGLSTEGRKFANFQDEFVGTAEPQKLSSDFDPRRSSKHVARTAAFQRTIHEIPVGRLFPPRPSKMPKAFVKQSLRSGGPCLKFSGVRRSRSWRLRQGSDIRGLLISGLGPKQWCV